MVYKIGLQGGGHPALSQSHCEQIVYSSAILPVPDRPGKPCCFRLPPQNLFCGDPRGFYMRRPEVNSVLLRRTSGGPPGGGVVGAGPPGAPPQAGGGVVVPGPRGGGGGPGGGEKRKQGKPPPGGGILFVIENEYRQTGMPSGWGIPVSAMFGCELVRLPTPPCGPPTTPGTPGPSGRGWG